MQCRAASLLICYLCSWKEPSEYRLHNTQSYIYECTHSQPSLWHVQSMRKNKFVNVRCIKVLELGVIIWSTFGWLLYFIEDVLCYVLYIQNGYECLLCWKVGVRCQGLKYMQHAVFTIMCMGTQFETAASIYNRVKMFEFWDKWEGFHLLSLTRLMYGAVSIYLTRV